MNFIKYLKKYEKLKIETKKLSIEGTEYERF